MNSPISLSALICAAIGLAAVGPFFVFLLVRAINYARRTEAEARIREAEAAMMESAAIIAQARASLVARFVKQADVSGRWPSDVLIEELLKQMPPAVATLGTSPLIGNIGLSLPKS